MICEERLFSKERIDALAEQYPDDLLRLFRDFGGVRQELAEAVPSGFDQQTCACGLPIIRWKDHPETGWYHATGERGCRAALFDIDEEKWLDSRDSGKARPAR